MAPQNPSPLTLEEHKELGMEFRSVRARLTELYRLVVEVYGSPNLTSIAFQHTIESLEKLSADLEAQAEADHPGCQVAGFYS